jgi:glycosyltransferase involved in cell wall biosynthesis
MKDSMSTSEPLISVIITCFNYARYVGKAIESALAQSYPHTEIVVVNDGSTDGSEQVIARYAHRVRVIEQTNQGSIAAYNAGFSASRGEIIVLLDADDLLHPHVLARVAKAWSPTCAKVQWDLGIIDAQGRDLGRKFCNFDSSYDAKRVDASFKRTGTYRWPVSVGNAYARWFASVTFPLDITHGPDGTLNTLAPIYGEVITIPAVLGYYRIHQSNRWSSAGSERLRLPERIEHRRTEIAALRRHAEARGLALPPEYPLDHEIAFLNYRFMARKLNLDYADCQLDSTWRLLASAARVLRAERYPFKLALAHGLWFGALAAAPRAAAPTLIRLRFNRAAVTQPYRDALANALSVARRVKRTLRPSIVGEAPSSRT